MQSSTKKGGGDKNVQFNTKRGVTKKVKLSNSLPKMREIVFINREKSDVLEKKKLEITKNEMLLERGSHKLIFDSTVHCEYIL